MESKVKESTRKPKTTTVETSTSVTVGNTSSPFSFSANVSGFSDILDYPFGAALNDRAKLALAYARLALAVENGNNLKEEVIGLMGGQPSQTAPVGQSGAQVPGNVSSSPDLKPRLHLLLLATWSSGSTFLTKLITHYPGTFLTFEPMVYIKGYGAVEQSRAEDAVSILRSVFMCNYTTGSPANKMLNFLKGSGYKKWPLHNIRLRNICENVATDKKDDLCLSPDFLGKACQLYPTHLVKTVRKLHFVTLSRIILSFNIIIQVRMRVAQAEPLLQSPQGLNLKIIVLFRDPRAVRSEIESYIAYAQFNQT